MLIAKQGVVTVAHAVRSGMAEEVTMKGKSRKLAALVGYPSFKLPDDSLMTMKGDAAPLMNTLAAVDDIALLKLSEPVSDVTPVPLYRGTSELGAVVRIYGKGAAGNGLTGQVPDSPHRGELRRAYNYLTSADGKWIGYRFDEGAKAHPVEGMLGDGGQRRPRTHERRWKG